MKKQYKKALFIFRRDLRLEDNTGLIQALEVAEQVIACFIFTPEQIDHNPFKSNRCLQFMLESLEDLDEQLGQLGSKLHLFYGSPEEVIKNLIDKEKIDLCVVNKDYTPYAIFRDKKIEKSVLSYGISFLSYNDALLHEPEECLKADGKPYTIFTPFFKHLEKSDVPEPKKNHFSNYYKKPIDTMEIHEMYQKMLPQKQHQAKGGRSEGLKILKKIQHFADYESAREVPELDATTHLSAHLKFTTVSPREVYHQIQTKLGLEHPLLRSLYWRDFFSIIALKFPHVFKSAFHKKFDKLQWQNDKHLFQKWCEGSTGFPIVDAGMRELNETGFMHNRLRMIVGSFLVKDLHIDWRWGEKYFATHLIDYDPAVNNGNWQWVASTGCDAQPYFRVFNPWRQQEKFDPDCGYIKRWIPELKNISPKIIHHWENCENWNMAPNYFKPIIDHSTESAKALKQYKACSS